ncbi:MAG: T9SS type A sorting domain-containing protein [Calditrichaeota bacterium]|nr:T9SS type A sorting domain-containing protein [Calditrichota bacterium]
MRAFFRFAALLVICFLSFIPTVVTYSSPPPNLPVTPIYQDLHDSHTPNPFSKSGPHRDQPIPPELLANPNLIEDELLRGDIREYVVNITNNSDEAVSFEIDYELLNGPEEDDFGRSIRSIHIGAQQGPYRDDPGDVIGEYNIQFTNCFGLAWDYDNSLIWGLNYNDPGVIYSFNPENNEIVSQFNVPQGMYGLFYLEGAIYVGDGDRDDNLIYSYDTEGNELNPRWSPINLRRTFVAGTEDYFFTHERRVGTINVFDFENLEPLGTIQCDQFLNGEQVYAIVWVEAHPNGQLWMAGERFIYQFFVDEDWNCEMVQSFPVPRDGEDYNGLTHDGENIWYGSYNEGNGLFELDDGVKESQWLSLDPEEGEIPGEGDLNLLIQIDASRLIEGDYEGVVFVLPEDEEVPDIEIMITFNITAAPVLRMSWEIGQEENVINWNEYFDEVYVEGEYAVPLTITNVGSEILRVREIRSDNEFFSADPGELILEPDDSEEIEVTFFPPEMEEFRGTLTILCNDPGEEESNIDLRADAFNPPVIFIDPLEFVQELLTGDAVELWFNIQNDGDAPLVWYSNIEVLDEPDEDGLGRGIRQTSLTRQEDVSSGPCRDNPGEVLAQFDIPYQRIEGLAWDDERSIIWGLNYNNQGSLFGINPENGQVVEDFRIGEMNMGLFIRNRIFYAGRNQNNAFIINLFDVNGELVDQFAAPIAGENMLIAASDEYFFIKRYNSGMIVVCDFDDLNQVGVIQLNQIDNGGQEIGAIEWVEYHPDGQLWLSGSNMIYQCSIDEDWNCEIVQSFPSPGGGGNLSGLGHDGTDLWFSRYEAMSLYRLDDGAVEARWMSIEPRSGEVAANGDMDVFLTLNADHLMGGEYEGSIHILSNDINDPDSEVFIAMTIIPASVFQASWKFGMDENQINFNQYYDEVYTNGNYPVEVTIRNLGSDVLNIEQIEIGDEVFSAQPEEFSVEVGEEATLTITFSPREMGEFRTDFLLTCNDPGNEEFGIELIAEALDPPVIFVDPQEIEEFLFTGDGAEHWINIQNEGAAVLNWNSQVEIFNEPDLDLYSRSVRSINGLSPTSNNGNLNGPYRDNPGDVIETLDFPHANSRGLAWDSDNSILWAINYSDPSCIFSYDIEEGNIIDQFNVWESSYGLFYLDGILFCGGNGRDDGLIQRYDIQGNELEPWRSPIDLSRTFVGGTNDFFMTHARRSEEVIVFDMENLELVSTIQIGQFIGGEQTYAFSWVEAHPEGQLWVAGDRNIYQFFVDEEWNCEIVQQFVVPNQGADYNGVTHDGENLLYSPNDFAILYMFDDGVEESNWITFEPRSGTIDPDFDTDTFVFLNAENLIGGLYEAFIHIFSNDPVNPEIEVHISLEVEGAPNITPVWEIGMEENRINWNRYFDEVYVSGDYDIPVRILNTGTDDLEIERIEFEDDVFTAQVAQMSIDPREEAVLVITFSPQEMNEFGGDIVITSNDPGNGELRIELVAESFDPPVIFVDPMEVAEFLFTGDESEHWINIQNEGAAPLRWTSDVELIIPEQDQNNRSVRSIATQGGGNRPPYRDDPGEILETYDVPLGRTEGMAWDFDRSWIWGLNYDEPCQIYAINPNDGEVQVEIRLPEDHMGLFYRDGVLHVGGHDGEDIIIRFDTEGNELEPLRVPFEMENVFISENEELLFTNQTRSGELNIYTFEGLDRVTTINYGQILNNSRIYAIEWIDEHPDGQLWLAGEELIYQCFVDEDWNCQFVQSFARPGQGQQYCGLAHDGQNLWFGYREDFNWYVIDDGVSEFNWITFEPGSGEINPNFDIDTFVTLSAADLIGGIYEASIHIFSNDPERPEVEIQVILEVEGAPNIDIVWEIGAENNQIDWNQYFDEVYVLGLYEIPVIIRNTGTDVLLIDELIVENEAFSCDEWVNEIDARDESEITISFAPEENREYRGELTIISNDPDNDQVTVELRASAFEPPDIEIDPEEINRFMFSGVSVDIPVILSNVGEAPLNWSADIEFIEELGLDDRTRQMRSITKNAIPARDDPWASVRIDEGVLQGGRDIDLQLELDTEGMFSGQYEAFIHILSNDPDEPEIEVHIVLEVEGVPEIEVEWEFGMEDNLINWNEYLGEVFITGTYTVPVTIYNRGTHELTINDIVFDNEAFGLENGQFVIPHSENEVIDVLFSPDNADVYEGVMTIVNDDRDEGEIAINLIGRGFAPPVIEVAPDAFDAEVRVGVRVNREFTIRNTGEARLRWRAATELVLQNEEDMGPVRDDPGDLIFSYRVPYDGNSGLAWDGELMWGISETNHRMYSLNPENGDVAHVHRIHDQPNGIAVRNDEYWIGQDDRMVNVYDRTGDLITAINLIDNVGLSSDQNAHLFLNDGEGSVWAYNINTGEYDQISYDNFVGGDEIASIYWSDDCRFGQLWLMGNDAVYQLFVDEEWNAVLYQQFEWAAESNNSGIAHDGTNLWHGTRDLRLWHCYDDGIEQLDWIRLDSYIGEVAQNRQVDITAQLDAFTLFGGVHQANIHILSNDPDDGDVVISVTLTVNGDPELETVPLAHPNEEAEVVSCGTAFVEEDTVSTAITITNCGTSNLILNQIVSSNQEFSFGLEEEIIIEPQTSMETEIRFHPVHHGLREAVIDIYTNAINIGQGDEMGHLWFTVNGNGVRHPEITTNPQNDESLDILNPLIDGPIERQLNLYNTGAEGAIPLRFIFNSVERENEMSGSSAFRRQELIEQPGSSSNWNDRGPRRDEPGDLIVNHRGAYSGIGGLTWAEDQMWGVSYTREILFAFDPVNSEVTFTIESIDAPTGMTYDGTHLWVGQRLSQWIYLYDLEGNQVQRVLMDFGIIGGIASDQRDYIYVNSREDSLIHVISMRTREEVTTFEFEAAMGNEDVWSIEWVPEHPEGQLWGLARHMMYQASVTDLMNTEPVQNFQCDAYHRFNGIAHDGENMWHGNWMNTRLMVVDDGTEEISIISWLDIEPLHGLVECGDSTAVTLTIHSSFLEAGEEYSGEIHILTNDLDHEDVVFNINISSEMIPRYFDSFATTEERHSLAIIDAQYEDEQIVSGCEIGVITPDGLVAGAVVWDNNPDTQINLAAFGDDPQTEEVEGFLPGESIFFRAWDYVTDTEWEFVYADFSGGPTAWRPGSESIVSISCSDEFSAPNESMIPEFYSLSNAYPNPFNSTTNIEYTLPITGHLYIGVYDISGREVAIIVNQAIPAGRYTATWNGAGATSGVYLIMMKANGFNAVRKVTLVR